MRSGDDDGGAASGRTAAALVAAEGEGCCGLLRTTVAAPPLPGVERVLLRIGSGNTNHVACLKTSRVEAGEGLGRGSEVALRVLWGLGLLI